MKKFILFTAMVMLMAAQVVKAQSVPRYYELVTADKNPFESGKYYVIVAIPEAGTFSYRMAYNGINETNHTGNAGRVTPNELHEQPGITPTSFSRILDIEKEGNHAVPLKIVKNDTKSTTTSTVYNLIDASVGTSNLVIGVNAATTGDSQHYLIGDAESTKDDPYHLWTISFATEDSELRAFIRDVGKTYYLKYDDNNYGADNSFFRVYASPTSEKRNVMLYKEMETKTAATSFTGHGTLYYSDKVLMVPDDVIARTYTLNANKEAVTSHTDYATEYLIPANSAVVLHGTASTTYTFPVTTLHNPTRDGDNILRGFDAASTTTSGTSDDSNYYFYKLTTKNSTDASSIGFYWAVNEGAPFTSAAHKAYLAVEKTVAANIRSFLLDNDDTPTSITPTTITHHPSPDGYVFDLTGRRFSSTQSLPKGIYISNGKKFVVK